MADNVPYWIKCKCGNKFRSPIGGPKHVIGTPSTVIRDCTVQCPKCGFKSLLNKMDMFYIDPEGRECCISFENLMDKKTPQKMKICVQNGENHRNVTVPELNDDEKMVL